jgi:AraC-like DNA-binding protein
MESKPNHPFQSIKDKLNSLRKENLSVDQDLIETIDNVFKFEHLISNISTKFSSLEVAQIDNEIGMSRAQFHRKIKSLTYQLTTHFIRITRLKRGRELLEKGADNLAEVAYSVDFSSRSYFSSAFWNSTVQLRLNF